MKIEIEIEATPAEVRQLLGLPDLAPLHDEWLAHLKNLMANGPRPADVERMMQAWAASVPGLAQTLEGWQRLFRNVARPTTPDEAAGR
ncbi:MAG: hypothetical protein NZM40_07985 [Sphingomonadaceae bacterium]|uniref:hypothetical protein n=1 Tax=Thermaurantiacus sp. TaxID=2820283 RepID=UPI00298EE31F|nr:hypothetical protein [Thermaurantiacus sp.]MCS6987350.1 hypothetical protein [Sphingomonadaceae bacterium]MDW8414571.1 hypothetical protein [Thermaurantiacus sp.]